MADIRINALATTAASTASDDFVAVDGSANGTRKLNAYSPSFGGNVSVNGTASVAGANKAVLEYASGSTTRLLSYGPDTSTPGGFQLIGFSSNESAGDIRLSIASSGNATFTGNLTVSGTTGANATDLTLGTSGPSVKSTLSARAPRQGLVFDGTAGATGTAVTIGTADLTFSQWVRVPSTVSETRGLFLFSPAGSIGATSLLGYVDSDATLNIHITGATSGDRTKQTLSGFVTSYAGKWVNILFTRVGSTWTGYINGVATTFSASTSGTAPTWAGSISGAVVNFGSLGSSGAIYNDAISAINLYNRALSASEVVALYEAGAPAGADYNNATNTSLITGDNSTFASDTGYWTLAAGATISGGNLNLAGNGSRADRTLPLSVGKKYRAVAVVTANTATDLILGSSTGGSYAILSGTGTLTGEFVASSTSFTIYQNGAGAITVDSITLVPIGLLLAPDAAQAGGGLVWYDTSGNAANISWTSGVSWNVPSSRVLGGNWSVSGTYNGTSGLLNIGTGVLDAELVNLAAATDGVGLSLLSTKTGGRRYFIVSSGGTSGYGQGKLVFGDETVGAYMALASTGNFLVGTTIDGGQKLQVSGNARLTSYLEISGGTGANTTVTRIVPSGWNGLTHRYGVQSSGDTTQFSTNAAMTAAGTGNLDDTTVGAGVLNLSGASLQYFTATAGTNPRSFTSAFTVDSSGNATLSGTVTATVNKSAANYTTVTTYVAAGSTTTTVHTFANANTNRSWMVSTRQQGSASNTVIGFATTYGGTLVVYRIAQSNTTGGVLDMNFTASGLNLQLVLGSGFGSTTWDTTITPIQG